MELSSLFLAGKGSALTSFFSTAFLVVFLPFCLVVYSLMPRRGKKYFLLAADCAFFWLISGKLLVYLLLTALSMHYFGLWLDKIQSETKLLLAQTEKAERKTVRKRQQANLNHVAIMHYNAFDFTYGELSFSMAVLDDLGNGYIFTNIHNRDDARCYCKRILNGESKHPLSDEEKEK